MTEQETSVLPRRGKPRIFYGYIIVAAGFSVMMIIHGTVNTFGVFFNPLLAEFDTSRAALSAASSISFFTMGFAAIAMGVLSDRFGPKVVLTIFAVFFSVGHFLMSQVNTLWQMYLSFAVIGIGFSPSDVVPLSTVVRWFVKRRGVMSGIMKIGTGLGLMVMPLLASALISKFEWRTSYIILGTLVLVTVIPLAQLLRRDPQEMGLLPDGERHLDTNGPVFSEEGLSLHEAIHTRQLWIVCGYFITMLFCAQSILVHIVPHAVDLGISRTIAAGVAATIGGSSMVGRLVMGFACDRIGYKRAMVICFLILVAALSWLQVANELWMLYLFAAIYGFNHGGFFTLTSPVVAGLFGTRAQGTLLGVVIFSGTLFGSISPLLTGRIFDITGSYQQAFLILLILAVVGLILAMLLKPISEGGKG
ncbi:MFS transporter [Chloroflexota bacterium]